jgi:pimeloyl-ACP methyl ester carboxylesterase
MQAHTTEFLSVRGQRLAIHQWGPANAPLLFMLHGWMDVAVSFQFVVDALSQPWRVIAPDARGFGQSGWPVREKGGGHYYFPDYLADLDGVLDHYAPDQAVNLVGHSMGANLACLYAGVRPKRVRRVVDLEGFGMNAGKSSDAPRRMASWLDTLRDPPRMRTYEALDGVAAQLRRNNPRLISERAAFLAEHWSRRSPDGRYEILADPAHKIPGAAPYRLDEVTAIWSQVEAPVLHVEGSDSTTLRRLAGDTPLDEFRARFEAFPDWRAAVIEQAGHMLHHDQPLQVAALIESFCA